MKDKHIDAINKNINATIQGCVDCLKTGDRWVELRICLTCGHVGCCDSSKNKHATKHFHETESSKQTHPIIQSYQIEQTWMWCYIDKDYIQDDGKKMYKGGLNS